MMANIPALIYITHLEREGPCIKLWGQTDRSLPIAIEKALQQMTPQFEQGMYSPAIENFQVGIMCCAKFKDDLYYRARITNISYLTQGIVEVLFIDYGNRDVISCMNTRTMSGLSTSLISIPAQARDFILSNVTLRNWDINTFEMISIELRYKEFQLVPMLEVGPYVLISLYLNKQDITEALVDRGLLLNIPIQIQQMTLQPLIPRNSPAGLSVSPQTLPMQLSPMPPKIIPASQPVPTPTLLTYKALPLDNESEHQVYVSYVSDGPCLFSVQLKRMEEQLKRLMTEINCMDLQSLEEYPLPGTVCLAQSSEDGYICRAVVTSMVDGQYKVFYVDFGNTEVLPFDKLFQIPFKYVIPKVMATRFALAGLENATVSIEMKCKFKEFVNNRPLYMRVKPAANRSALPLCELWDDNNIKALDMIRQAALLSYPEPAPLTRGLNQEIKVSFVYGCNRIYVQLKSKEHELKQLMNSLQQTCHSRPLLNRSDLKVGMPCCAIYSSDNLWYRAEILKIESESFKLRYIDFGNENVVSYTNIKVPLPEHITALRPQAIECCLNGYQNIEPDEQRDALLKELIYEQDLNMRVVEIQGNKALVDLYDKQHYNVASLLLEKIASASSMVSPLLIQDNHRIEHRKRSSPQANQKDLREKKPLRELNDRNRDNKQENWRQNKFSRNSEDDWNEQTQMQKQEKYYKSNNRNIESNRDTSECPENKNLFHHGNKRFGDQRSRSFVSRDKTEPMNNNNDNWDTKNNYENRDNFQRNRRNDFRGKGGFEKRDGFGKKDSFEKRDGFKKPPRNQDYQNQGTSDNQYQKPRKNYNDNRGNDDGFAKPRNRDFKRDDSEKSWSDASEKSWKKGPKSFDKGRNNKFGGSRKEFSPPNKFSNTIPAETESWDTSTAINNETTNGATFDYATETDKFEIYTNLLGVNELVSVSWFYNPVNFYCQLDKYKDEFKQMMEEIQTNYRNRPTGSPNVGAPVIASFSEDGALYRAEVLGCQFNQYHVRYVDYGNVATVNQVFPIEKTYMNLPAQAIPCSLQGIAPSGGNWPSPDSFSNYFDKDSFNCSFASFSEERYYIDLNYEEKNISNLLVENSLAISTLTPANIDINLLGNQQMIVVLRNVSSLSDITVEVEPGVTVKASMHNLASATETYEDNLKQWVGHFVIMFVDNVLEDRLEITLYDLTGQKLQILNPDEDSYDTVDPLCPLPIYSNRLRGWVSYASDESIYLQPCKFADSISQQLEHLFVHYDALTQEEHVQPNVGETYAVLSSDSNWYRGNVAEVKDDQVVVTYIDYGNTEAVPVDNLRELSPQFYQPHMLAVEILIPGDKKQYFEHEITVSLSYGSTNWEGEVLSDDIEDAEVEVSQQEPIQESPVQDSVLESITQQEASFEEPGTSAQIGVSVVISHIDSPSEFYIQLTDARESITLIQEQLKEQVSSLPDLENPTAGVLCAAPFSICHRWFRAQVLDADDDITTVRFVDFGNTDVISNSNVNVKTLPSDMLSIEYHAKLCSLFVKPSGEEWSAAALDNFETYTAVENLTAEIVRQDEKTTYIELYANGKNVGEMLKQDGLAVDMHLDTENNSTGFISHLNSPSEFWIQLESSCPDLEWVCEQLAGFANYPVLEDLTPGSLCAAVFHDDDSLYRARILSNTVAGLEVIFIDYGNSCSCSSLRELPEDLIMLPPLAVKCSLQKPNGILQWSQAATDKFKEISAEGATIFNVNVLTPGETSIVELTYDGQDVSDQLLPETRECFVSHVESLDSFWVQFMDDNAKIENVTEELEKAETWPTVADIEEVDLVAALYENGMWYRARVTGKSAEGYEVLFVDYGNTANANDLRQLPDVCATIEPLATNCKLDTLPRTKWSEKSEEIFRNMTDHGAAIFKAEIVSDNTIRLYLLDADIRPSLELTKCSPSISLQSSPKKTPSNIQNTQQESKNHSALESGEIVENNEEPEEISSVGEAEKESISFEKSSTSIDTPEKNELKENLQMNVNSDEDSTKMTEDITSTSEPSIETSEEHKSSEATRIVENHLEEIIDHVIDSNSNSNGDETIEISSDLVVTEPTKASGEISDKLEGDEKKFSTESDSIKNVQRQQRETGELADESDTSENVQKQQEEIHELASNSNTNDNETIEISSGLVVSEPTKPSEEISDKLKGDVKKFSTETTKLSEELSDKLEGDEEFSTEFNTGENVQRQQRETHKLADESGTSTNVHRQQEKAHELADEKVNECDKTVENKNVDDGKTCDKNEVDVKVSDTSGHSEKIPIEEDEKLKTETGK